MGVAAFMIYFAHFYAYADLGVVNRLFAYGNWGVDVFLLLSGFGICHSMSKSPSDGDFYLKRFVRVGVPYLCSCYTVLLCIRHFTCSDG